MTTPDSSDGTPPFWNGEGERPKSKPQGGGLTTLAEYAPPLLRPFARVLAGAMNGGSALSMFSIAVLMGLGIIFIAGEVVETKRDWYASEASQAQVALFGTQAALFHAQRLREEAETEVAVANLSLTVEQEAQAIAVREQAIWDSAKPLEEGWGDARASSAFSAMLRYRELFNESETHRQRCLKESCSSQEVHRWSTRSALFHRLFYTAVAFLNKAGISPRDGVVRQGERGVLSYPAHPEAFDLNWRPEVPEQPAEEVAPGGERR